MDAFRRRTERRLAPALAACGVAVLLALVPARPSAAGDAPAETPSPAAGGPADAAEAAPPAPATEAEIGYFFGFSFGNMLSVGFKHNKVLSFYA